MCGISGVFVFRNSNFSVTEEYVARMRDAMAHRGPDGSGSWISADRRVGLGHRRLSIIDLSSSANQPMSSIDGTLHVVFNGEIYNHAEIRRELEQLGHGRWKTDHSDTEVILHAFQEWGIDCIERFRGMFAMGLWDANARRLWLIRDRIGIKPLYYSIHHGRLTFASEIKALLKDPEQARAVNEEALFHYLTFVTTPAPDTLFAGIRKVPPGTYLTIDESGQMRQQRYWDVLDRTQPLTEADEEEICERLMAELRASVALRTVSDVPVGVFLSGGVDSSTNTALFSECAPGRVKTFSVGYDRDYRGCRSELEDARGFANHIGSEHYERVLTQDDFVEFLPRMIYLQDEPIADPVCMPVYYVSQLARDNGVIVAQVGEGADELFWGYGYWRKMYDLIRCNSYPIPRFVKKLGLGCLMAAGQSGGLPYELLHRGVARRPIFWSGFEGFTHRAKLEVLSPRLRAQFCKASSWDAIQPAYNRFLDKAWERTPIKWMTYADLNLRLPELLLMRVDKMGMGVGLEARVPFLDHKVVELAMSIPESFIAAGGQSKHVLKKAVRGLIPDQIVDRPKQGFGVPIYEWFFDRFGEFAKRELSEFSKKTDFLDRARVLELVHRGRGWQIWFLLNFALWWKEFVEESSTAAPVRDVRASASSAFGS